MDSILTLKEAKKYLRIDYDEDDSLLQSLVTATVDYLRDAIDDFDIKATKEKFVKRAKILACVLLQEWYDNREQRESKDLSYTSRSLMLQLQNGGNYD
jgi:DNA packaging protein, QLRG family